MRNKRKEYPMDLLTACKVACRKSRYENREVYVWRTQDGKYCIDSRLNFRRYDEFSFAISANEKWEVNVEWVHPGYGDTAIYAQTAEWIKNKLNNTDEWLPPINRKESPKTQSFFSEKCPVDFIEFKRICNSRFFIHPNENQFLTYYLDYVGKWNDAKKENKELSDNLAVLFFRDKQEGEAKMRKKKRKADKIKQLILPRGFFNRWLWLIFGK